MNEKVREYLIAVARQDNETVYYSELIKDNSLKIDLSTPEGQNRLKQLLIQISTYENRHNRPMLTALAVNKRENDEGPGFYTLAEQFGFGKKADLRKRKWGKDEAARVRQFWQEKENYEKYSSLQKKTTTVKTIEKLFDNLVNSEEYPWAKDWQENYVSFVREVKKLQTAITNNPELPLDDDRLYKKLSNPIHTYEGFMARWLKEKSNGISSRGQSVLSESNFYSVVEDTAFKTIARVVISDPTVNSYNLLMNWWYANENISNKPLLINRAVAACAPEILSSTVHDSKFWYVVDVLRAKYGYEFSPDPIGNWFAANQQLTAWLDQKLQASLAKVSKNLTDQHVWRNIFVWLIYEWYHGKPKITANELIQRAPPENGYTEIPVRAPNFEGYDVDFEKKAKEQKDLGDAGEELVMHHEIKQLRKIGLGKLANKVRKAKTNEGFDVLSFSKNGKEKFIEVKTTSEGALHRFYLTRHEIEFMRLHKGQYSLYRVYHFDEENNSGEFFELVDDVEEQIIKDPTQYEVLLKKK